jgi:hypothetical protein
MDKIHGFIRIMKEILQFDFRAQEAVARLFATYLVAHYTASIRAKAAFDA